jgi:hypothetical protein
VDRKVVVDEHDTDSLVFRHIPYLDYTLLGGKATIVPTQRFSLARRARSSSVVDSRISMQASYI